MGICNRHLTHACMKQFAIKHFDLDLNQFQDNFMNVHCTDIVPDEELNAKQVEKTPRLH